MPWVNCKICAKNFYAKPNHLEKGWGTHCSQKCNAEDRKKHGKVVTCYVCKKPVYKTPRALKHSKSGNYFCTKSCQTIWRNSMVYIGENHPNWKDGGSRHYRDILKRSRQKESCRLCKTSDARILAVHHLDHNHSNNKLENLAWLCHNCHYLIHHHADERQRLYS